MGRNHNNPLLPSEPDDTMLIRTVEHNFIELCGLYKRVNQQELQIPKDMVSTFKLWRSARLRHKNSDFRHTRDEMRATRAVAEWTLRVKAKICNVEPNTVEWRD